MEIAFLVMKNEEEDSLLFEEEKQELVLPPASKKEDARQRCFCSGIFLSSNKIMNGN